MKASNTGKHERQKAEVKKEPKPRATRATRATRQIHEQIEWRKLTIAEVRAITSDGMRVLRDRAYSGDSEAARGLLNMAFLYVDDLERLTRSKEDGMNGLPQLIRVFDQWPVMFPARKQDQVKLAARMRKLGLGADCETNVSGKWDENAPTTKSVRAIFFFLFSRLRQKPHPGMILSFSGCGVSGEQNAQWREWVKANAAKLPNRLTKENARDWGRPFPARLRNLLGQTV